MRRSVLAWETLPTFSLEIQRVWGEIGGLQVHNNIGHIANLKPDLRDKDSSSETILDE